ncbi:MAG: phosphotransferase, partial [Aquificales bacterium]|nr:phosphotransferase [Aquificales bacterium]
QAIPANLPVGLTHGDLFYDNVLFEDGKLKAILDFESACQSYLVFDLGMAVVGLCADDTSILLEKARAFVDGYQTVRLLEDTEKESLQMLVELSALLTSAWRYWKYNIDVPNAEKANKHLQMVNFANETNAIPQSVWRQAIFS